MTCLSLMSELLVIRISHPYTPNRFKEGGFFFFLNLFYCPSIQLQTVPYILQGRVAVVQ